MQDYEVTPPPDRIAEKVQIRTAFTTEQGEVVRFMVQLEYWHSGDWKPVVRYDHDRDAEGGHDIAAEGLHMDIYRDGEKVDVKDVTGPIPATEGFDYAEDDLRENVQQYIKRFEQWHDIKNGSNL
ncbi:hypothetical protein Hrd1104_01805 [Halorhabdus sp. CBA1104]|uniref:DUF7718 family protein n=1 Tax=Halorhabdus sp. CBA1104 TaxID=1380432 RepID=UPI0012B1D859|nr:hypothetical protein [Halorhabdus sp. CBA1104]QGN06153.1 hypothetical protein Hrd1104_01805 [Halorhabdus sp. CBA1104]